MGGHHTPQRSGESFDFNRNVHQLRFHFKKSISIVGCYFDTELGPGIGVERVSVGPHTLKEGNKRGDRMKQWLMLQRLLTLNTMYRKTTDKQVTYTTPKGAEKQLDYILVDRKHLSYSRDAEANDMIHMGSDHTSVMAQLAIAAPTKENSPKTLIKGKRCQQWRATRVNTMEDENPKRQRCSKSATVNLKAKSGSRCSRTEDE